MRPTVLVVDDHPQFRRSARALLTAEGFDVIGEAADGDEAVAAAVRLTPQVVLLDIQLPGHDGFAVAARLRALPVPPSIVLISGRDPRTFAERLSGQPFLAKDDLSGAALAALVGCDG